MAKRRGRTRMGMMRRKRRRGGIRWLLSVGRVVSYNEEEKEEDGNCDRTPPGATVLSDHAQRPCSATMLTALSLFTWSGGLPLPRMTDSLSPPATTDC
jgi:hypothetical protein